MSTTDRLFFVLLGSRFENQSICNTNYKLSEFEMIRKYITIYFSNTF